VLLTSPLVNPVLNVELAEELSVLDDGKEPPDVVLWDPQLVVTGV